MNIKKTLAPEIVSKGLALFALHKGNTKDAILSAVNFGRDTDCLAAVAGGLCGALSGTEGLPNEWISQVNEAVKKDPYTNNQRDIDETADGLYEAFKNRNNPDVIPNFMEAQRAKAKRTKPVEKF